MTREEAFAALLNCCGSREWARQVCELRPFRHADELAETADRAWWNLEPQDWLEAFRSHPKIGERKTDEHTRQSDEESKSLVEKRDGKDGAGGKENLSSRWSEAEQSRAQDASQETLEALADANETYENKFGHIFIVCATGKNAGEMLSLLHQRMDNDSGTELRVAAEEQRRITRLRLEKLLNS